MDVYILRHAIAVERGTKGYRADSQRPLTDKGAEKMHRIGQGMLALHLSFDQILSSPFVRARQTAEIVGDVFDENVTFTPHLQVGGDPRKLIDFIRKQCKPGSTVLLVGHEPYLSGLISMLTAGVKTPSITLKKGGLCKLSVDNLRYGRCATMEWLFTPHQLTLVR